MVELNGGVAVITGAGRGLGAAIARAVARRGMRLVLADINREALETVAAEISELGIEVIAVPTNVSDPHSVDRLAAVVSERMGDVSLLVNNAGIEMIAQSWNLPSEDWQRIIGVNVLGPLFATRAFVPDMVAARKPAIILNIASLGALGMMALQTPYIMTKHALLAFSEGLYLEMQSAAPMVGVSVALPGPIATGIFDEVKVRVDDDAGFRMHEALQAMLARDGLMPDGAADLIIEGALAGEFWITTHPHMLEAAALQRANYLTAGRRPDAPLLPAGSQAGATR